MRDSKPSFSFDSALELGRLEICEAAARLSRIPGPVIMVAPADCALIPVASVATGLSQKAIRRMIEEGVWLEGRHYHRAPNGRVWIEMKEAMAWVRGDRAAA